MKKKIITYMALILIILICPIISSCGCSLASTVGHNIQKSADNFNVYRRMTFVNLYTDTVLYSVEGYFSLQTSYSNEFQGQQEVAIVIQVKKDEYQMHYFSIANNVTYVIEQVENTHTNPYYWDIIWYIPLPNIKGV